MAEYIVNDQPATRGPYPLTWDEGFQDFYSELHNRPFPVLITPARLSHIALLRDKSLGTNEQQHALELEHLQALCLRYGMSPPIDGAAGYYQSFGEFEVRWERHSEFCTYTFIVHGNSDTPFSEPPIALLPEDWVAGLPGKVVTAVHIEMLPGKTSGEDIRSREPLRPYFEGQRLIGCELLDGGAEVWSAFRLHSDNFNRVLLYNHNVSPCQSGRLMRGLLELETYRNMALIALPLAVSTSHKVAELEQRLANTLAAIDQLQHCDDERHLLSELSQMAASIADLMASTRFRFDATKAYYQLVLSRLKELRETEIGGLQTMTEFVDRRLTPAYRTTEAARHRMDDLSRRTDRASDYLRTRIDLQIEAQNQSLLKSMDHRIELQVHMQETVEILSFAAISYALVGLFKLMLGALPLVSVNVDKDLWGALFVPVSIVLVWLLFRVVKRRVVRRNRDNV